MRQSYYENHCTVEPPDYKAPTFGLSDSSREHSNHNAPNQDGHIGLGGFVYAATLPIIVQFAYMFVTGVTRGALTQRWRFPPPGGILMKLDEQGRRFAPAGHRGSPWISKASVYPHHWRQGSMSETLKFAVAIVGTMLLCGAFFGAGMFAASHVDYAPTSQGEPCNRLQNR